MFLQTPLATLPRWHHQSPVFTNGCEAFPRSAVFTIVLNWFFRRSKMVLLSMLLASATHFCMLLTVAGLCGILSQTFNLLMAGQASAFVYRIEVLFFNICATWLSVRYFLPWFHVISLILSRRRVSSFDMCAVFYVSNSRRHFCLFAGDLRLFCVCWASVQELAGVDHM